MSEMHRRDFLVAAGATALGALLAACGNAKDVPNATGVTTAGGAAGGAAGGQGSKPVRKVKLGFIALTDASSVIMAKELGYFAERDLDVEVIKQASWPATRDALLNNQIDGCHGLYTLPSSVATGIGGNSTRDLRIAMMLNNNGQAITLSKDYAAIGYGDPAKARSILESRDAPSMAMTFPGGTHDLWLRYWLLATKANLANVKISPVPPAQMVQNMSVGNVDGYCVGEPWGAVAVHQGIGFTHIASQDIWLNHPEKALVVTEKFATEQRDTLKDVMGAVLQASKWIDDPANRSRAAETVAPENYINAPAADIRGRLTGLYDLGGGLGTRDYKGEQMQFSRNGQVNFPRRGHLIWAMSQYVRMGLLKEAPPYQQIADQLVLTDLYAEVARAEGIPIPDDDMAPFEIRLDKTMFDPRKPDQETKRL
ncbi:MAG: CmpA/NrtA family ABC transporter substrate-binding protein [Acidimicrobiales bacterium]